MTIFGIILCLFILITLMVDFIKTHNHRHLWALGSLILYLIILLWEACQH